MAQKAMRKPCHEREGKGLAVGISRTIIRGRKKSTDPHHENPSPRSLFFRRYFLGDLFDRDFSLSGKHDGSPISKNATRAGIGKGGVR